MTYKIQPVRCKLVNDGAALRRAPVEQVRHLDDAGKLLTWYYAREALPHERLVAILLRGNNEIRGIARLSEGGLHTASVTISDVLRPVIVGGVNTFVLAHNHPSGDPTPSVADIDITRQIVTACKVVDLRVLDHIVVGNTCLSIADFLGLPSLLEV